MDGLGGLTSGVTKAIGMCFDSLSSFSWLTVIVLFGFVG